MSSQRSGGVRSITRVKLTTSLAAVSPAIAARTVTLACGHALQLEAPEALLAALRTALAPAAAASAAL